MLEIDPKTAPIVKEIFQRYDDGELMKDIVDSLNSRGLLTAAGKPFRIASLGTVLKNRKYLGEYHYGTICIPDKLPVIIEKNQFERVQQRMESNRHAPAKAKADEEYLLTTKLFCGKCGKMLAGESGTSRTGAKHCTKYRTRMHWQPVRTSDKSKGQLIGLSFSHMLVHM